ncbi:MAG TPA: hypothetical protein VGL03_00895 [Thermoanaerobaculia bacterium]
MADRPMAYDVFISYEKQDKEVAQAVCAGLEAPIPPPLKKPGTVRVKRMAAQRDRSIEIDTHQFKLEIPH